MQKDQPSAEQIAAAVGVIGSVWTEKKARSSAQNAARARQHRGPVKPCSCGSPDGKHKAACPVYIREYQQRKRAKTLSENKP